MKKLVLTAVMVFAGIPILGQENIPAAGGDVIGTEGSVSYSIGQVVYTIKKGINGFVVEGVQQPYEISVLVGIEPARNTNLICTVYPNPTNDLLTLEVDIADNENLFYQLYDMLGKLLVSKNLIDKKTIISMANLAPATYFLKVTDNQKVVITFKIIKNHKIQ
jgi:hypothetical protein